MPLEKQLPYTVECNQGRYWETIAAFDIERAALAYMAECSNVAREFAYRVRRSDTVTTTEIVASRSKP